MKKILLILLSTIILTGCNATYKLNITKNNIEEKLNVREVNKNNWDTYCSEYVDITCTERFKMQTQEKIPVIYQNTLLDIEVNDMMQIYDTTYINNNNEIGFSYNYNFDMNNYNNSTIVNSCIENFNLKKQGDGTIVINASGKFKCNYNLLEYLTLEVTSDDYTITNDNADSKKSGKYIWNIKLNEDNKIYFELKDYTQRNKIMKYVLIGVVILSIIIIIAFIIVRKMSRKNNQI